MADFMRYLNTETVEFIKMRHANGEALWAEVLVNNRIDYVLGHPNGWVGLPQQRMRKCAVLGGLVANDVEASKRVKFVTEGEASALSCLAEKLSAMELPVH